MKRPNVPYKPYPPHKPNPPISDIEEQTNLGTLCSDEYDIHSIESIKQYIVENYPTVNPDSVRFTMEISTTTGYYDEVFTHLNIKFFTINIVKNPYYDELYSKYENNMKRYDEKYKKYEEDIKQYNIDYNLYKTDINKYRFEKAKQTIQEKKLNAS